MTIPLNSKVQHAFPPGSGTQAEPELSCGKLNLETIRQKGIYVVETPGDGFVSVAGMLAKSGFEKVVSTPQPQDDSLIKALRKEARNLDLILLDISQAGIHGLELCRRIHDEKAFRDTPIIIIASKNIWHEDFIYSAFLAGAIDIVFKPVQRLELIPRVISSLLLKSERDLRKNHKMELENELAERKVIEARLQYLVSHDELTGLCNRRRLEQALETAVFHARRKHYTSTLLYIDLDQFKVINDTEGHTTGDRFLMSIANELRREIHKEDILARISSDEYAILIENTTEEAALRTAETLRRVIDEYRFSANDKEYHIGASIGIAMIKPEEELTASEILARSAQACFEAKTHGRNMVHMFSHDDVETHIIRNAVNWVPKIRDAIENDRLCMYYQPVVDVESSRICGHEALIRMHGHDGQIITPEKFIPIAERMGLIRDIDFWVINHVIDVLSRLPEAYGDQKININLSMFAFQDPALLPLVCNKLAATGVSASRITFEITETAAVSNYAHTRRMIKQLRKLGCCFALDDFGTGFSSFNYIKQFPVDYLKIDGCFIRNLIHDKVDQRLVRSMIDVAKTLNKKIVAEFVENKEVLGLLKEYGIDMAQGYYIAPPGPEPLLTPPTHA